MRITLAHLRIYTVETLRRKNRLNTCWRTNQAIHTALTETEMGLPESHYPESDPCSQSHSGSNSMFFFLYWWLILQTSRQS